MIAWHSDKTIFEKLEFVALSEKIKRELGWQPRRDDLREIIASAWDWHKSHTHGYEDRAL